MVFLNSSGFVYQFIEQGTTNIFGDQTIMLMFVVICIILLGMGFKLGWTFSLILTTPLLLVMCVLTSSFYPLLGIALFLFAILMAKIIKGMILTD